ncbi:hypothetical protein ABK040_009298 [Willaertia magna]
MSKVVDEKALGLDLKKKKTTKKTEKSTDKTAKTEGSTTEKKPKEKKEKKEKVDSEELQQLLQEATNLFTNYLKTSKQPSKDNEIDTEAAEDEEVIELVDLLKLKKGSELILQKNQQQQKSGGSYWTTDSSNNGEKTIKDLASIKDEDHGPAAWNKSDREYKYTELLERMYQTLKKNNPELGGGKKKAIKVKTPQVARDGPKKTVLINFTEICANLHRAEQHVLDYIFVELGTTGNLDGSNRLVIKGVFKDKDVENLLRKYINEYVVCRICGSLDTRLNRDPNTRLSSIVCTNCQASRTVQAVKQGFVANVTRRRN